MNKIIFLIAVSLVTIGCGKQNIDRQLAPYVSEFEQRYNVHFDGDATINNTMPQAGICHPDSKNIEISKSLVIDQNQPELIRALVFHELGHCLLDKEHDNDSTVIYDAQNVAWNCPISIMNKFTPNDVCLNLLKDQYDAQLPGSVAGYKGSAGVQD